MLGDGEFERLQQSAADLAAVARDLFPDHRAHGVDVRLDDLDRVVVVGGARPGGVLQAFCERGNQR